MKDLAEDVEVLGAQYTRLGRAHACELARKLLDRIRRAVGDEQVRTWLLEPLSAKRLDAKKEPRA